MWQQRSEKVLSQYIPTILQWITISLLVTCVVAASIEWFFHASNSLDLDYIERWLAYIAYQAFHSGYKVTSVYEMPYNTLPYPPMSYLVHGGIGRLIGADLIGVRTIGRAISLTATVLSSLLIIRISWTLGVKRLWSLLAGLLFLVAQEAHFFAVSLRPDELACTLMLLSIYSIIRQRNYWLIGAIFALLLATKHSFITVPLVLVVILLLKRDIRSLLKLIGGSCLAGLFIVTVSTWLLGMYWWQGPLLQGLHSADIKQMLFFIGAQFKQPVLIIGLACIFLVEMNSITKLISTCFLVSLLINSIAYAKVGAAGNYSLEPVALASILVALVAEQFLESRLLTRAATWALVASLLISPTIDQLIQTSQEFKSSRGVDTQQLNPLISFLQAVNRPILTSNSTLYFASGHLPYVCPPDLIMAAIEGGKLNDQPIRAFIEQRGFGAVVVQTNWKERRFFPQSWISLIEQNYEEIGIKSGFRVMQPKK